jgi:hypothetical protein
MLAGGSAANQNNPSDDSARSQQQPTAPARLVVKSDATDVVEEKTRRIIREFRKRLNKKEPGKPQQ